MRRSLLLIPALVLVALTTLASGPTTDASGPGPWKKFGGGTIPNFLRAGIVRNGQVLHVAFARSAGGKYEIALQRIRDNGTFVDANPKVLVGNWSGLADPGLVRTSNGRLRMFWVGTESTATDALDGLITSSGSADGSSWTAPQLVLKEGGTENADQVAATVAGAEIVQAWTGDGGIGVHSDIVDGPVYTYGKVLSSGSPLCCSSDAALATDSATGKVYAAWCDNDDKADGIIVQEVNPANGKSAGPKHRLDGSYTAFGGQQIRPCNGVKPEAMVSRQGGGVYVAAGVGYPTPKRLKIWKLGTADPQPIEVGGVGEYKSVAIAADQGGRLWVAWADRLDNGEDVIRVRRSNAAVTAWEDPITITPPAGQRLVYDLAISAKGDLDLLARLGDQSSGAVAMWYAQVKP